MIRRYWERLFEIVLQVGVVYLWHLAEADNLPSFVVHSKKHGSGLRGLSLQQLQGLVQSLSIQREANTSRKNVSEDIFRKR